jgi:excisionase family DNA binding protein
MSTLAERASALDDELRARQHKPKVERMAFILAHVSAELKLVEKGKIEKVLMPYKEAADYLSVPMETVRSWAKRGVVQRIRIGRRSFVLKKQVDELIYSQVK